MRKLLILAAAVLLSGCASMVGEPTQTVEIRSTPSQANIVVINENATVVYRGTTPASITLPKAGGGFWEGHDYSVEVSRPGYGTEYGFIEHLPSSWYILGNLGTLGVGWFVVDPTSGAMWDLSPRVLNIALSPELESPSAAGAPAAAPGRAAAPSGPAAAAIAPVVQTSYGVHLGSYETLDMAQRGWSEIWGKYWKFMSDTKPRIEYVTSDDGKVQYHLYGKGLHQRRADILCSNFQQRNE
ncbi:MAG: hypothetical protein O7A68_09065 [Alphaproteobacteria bacterium]|nr:hypothetical protein [Alphaproteobacteria bacterium]